MKKTTQTLIKYSFPSLLFAADATEEVNSTSIPKKLPRNCFAFRFGSQDIVTDGKDVYTKPVKWKKKVYIIGKTIKLRDIPDTDKNRILRSNIENNSPFKTGILTHLGNWQCFDENTEVLDVKSFSFEDRWV